VSNGGPSPVAAAFGDPRDVSSTFRTIRWIVKQGESVDVRCPGVLEIWESGAPVFAMPLLC
jgi:hypothetical protein